MSERDPARRDVAAADPAARLREEGLDAGPWSNGPLDRYSPHEHGFDKVLVCAAGSIRFGLPDRGVTIDLPAGGKNALSLGIIPRSESGTPYGADADVSLFDADFNDYVANPGYLNPPATSTYFFGPRDQFRTAWLYRTDLSVNYSRKLSAGGGPQAFAQFQFLNLFNQFQAFNNARSEISTTIRTAVNGNYDPFNPFVETPVKGVNWDYGSKFGEPVSKNAYTTPRTFRFSAGFRF